MPSIIVIFVGRWFAIEYSSAVGAIFCQVVIRRAVCIVEPCRTSGSQKCIGAVPTLIIRAMVIMVQA